MKKIILLMVVIILLISGCIHTDRIESKCLEAKDVTLRLINQIEEYNHRENKYGENLSYEIDVKTYNRLCGDVTGEIGK